MRTVTSAALGPILLLWVLGSGCQEQAGIGRAADPSKAPGPAPWGSATTNAELDKKMKLLEDILDGKLTAEGIGARVQKEWPDLTPEQRTRALVGVTTLLEELTKAGRAGQRVADGPDRDFARANLLFSERRFIEAAKILSRLLDTNPVYPEARNLLARCFFFLGNRDRTIEELEFILTHPEQQKDKDEVLDALFLLGAAVAETPGISRENLDKGKGAWETYLKMAPDSPQADHIKRGIADIEAGLRGEGPLAQPVIPVASEGGDNEGGDVRGGAPSGAGGSTTAPPENRSANLKPDASPFERALAGGLDALDKKDLAAAETQLQEALKLNAASPEALTGLARVYVQSGRIPEALRTFGEAIKLNADYMPAWHYNGMAHMMSGSPGEAVKSWTKIQDKDPSYFAKFNLQQRVDVARRMAQGR